MDQMKDSVKLARHVIAAAVLLGLLADWWLRPGLLGINVLLWTVALVACAQILAARHRMDWEPETAWLALHLLVFGWGFAWRDAVELRLLNLLALGLASTMWMVSSEKAGAWSWGVLDYVRGALNGVASAVTGPTGSRGKLRIAPAGEERPAAARYAVSGAVGLAVAFPLLLLFGGLLTSADAVFDRLVSNALDFDFATITSHVAVSSFFAWTVAGLLLLVFGISRPALTDPLPVGRPRLGIVELGVPLALLDLLFLAFVIVQLRYLFGDASLVEGTVGLTYAEYARNGFFQLVTVAALVLPLLLLSVWALSDLRPRSLSIFRALAGIQLGLLSVIMASAVKRMLLYQTAYGLTTQRLYTTVFMVWIGIVMVLFAATVLRGRPRAFATGASFAGLSLIAALGVASPDRLIAGVNVGRAMAGEGLDGRYATGLSGDAVPTLVEALPELGSDQRCAIAARLLERWSEREPGDWRTWNYGRARARRAVEENQAYLRQVACPPAADQSADAAAPTSSSARRQPSTTTASGSAANASAATP